MIEGLRLKVCGLTSLVDAEAADRCGADYLGFVLYPKSPRHVSLEAYRAMALRLPERRKVAVMVEPMLSELASARDAGFDFFQIHFNVAVPLPVLLEWSEVVGEDRLWLAPKLPPASDVPQLLLTLAQTFLLDTFHAEGFGGSGRTGDWAKFRRHQTAYTHLTWILAGGLTPENIGDAVAQSGAKVVDVNSGVEAAPGVKDHGKLERLALALRAAATARRLG